MRTRAHANGKARQMQDLPGSLGSAAAAVPRQFTKLFRFFRGSARTFLLAGFALNVIFSPVNGFTPSRALVAGRFTTLSFSSPGMVNRPLPRRLFLMMP